MSLLGTGVLANWGGVVAASEDDYNAWHSLEHMPERLAVPGFRRGRRAVAVDGAPADRKYFMMYEVDAPAVLVSAPYLARLNDPTAWTRRILAQYVAPCRTVCRVVASEGRGPGGYIGTLQVEPSSLDAASVAAPSLVAGTMQLAGVIGAHALAGEKALGQQPTAEKRFRESRGEPDRTVSFALLVEGWDERPTAAALADLADAAREVLGGTLVATLYRTQHVVVPDDTARDPAK